MFLKVVLRHLQTVHVFGLSRWEGENWSEGVQSSGDLEGGINVQCLGVPENRSHCDGRSEL